MIELSFDWIAKQLDGVWYQNNEMFTPAGEVINDVTTDTRAIRQGALFIAIRGETFDGHAFIEKAIVAGASAVISDTKQDTSIPLLLVEDTRIALAKLAKGVKQEVSPKTVAMTGSSGKTTVKEMCGSILRQLGSVWTTPGNFNNDIGVPLSLLGLTHEHEYAVLELGANHAHEIAYTVGLVEPDACMVLNVSQAHLQGFGSLDGVANAKGEIYTHSPATATHILNLDCDYASQWLSQMKQDGRPNPITLSRSHPADIYATEIQANVSGCYSFVLNTPTGRTDIQLPTPGYHNVANALSAAALCIQVGASLSQIKSGLQALAQVKGRLYQKQLGRLTLIDDTYNANVGSMKAALDVLSQTQGEKLFIMGDMGELGDESKDYHSQIGEYARQHEIHQMFCVGQESQYACNAFGSAGRHYTDKQTLADDVIAWLSTHTKAATILVKGSRSAKMEQVVSAIESGVSIDTQNNGDSTEC